MYKELEKRTCALRLVRLLEGAGYEAWFVGGCVRDAMLGRKINDVDIATSARWQEVESICKDKGIKTFRSGVCHGTITVLMEDDCYADEGQDDGNSSSVGDCDINDVSSAYEAIEVTTYRVDSACSKDNRHPDNVEFVLSIEDDLARRDFTMNAMAWHPNRGIFDPFRGADDIEASLIRVVGDPRSRFNEDALRILRACRFASQLGFTIDGATYQAMLAFKFLVTRISSERITQELDLFIMGAFAGEALMRTVDVLSIVMPELIAMKGCAQVTKYHIYDVLEHTAYALQNARPDRLVRWAALCHDMGKPACAFFDSDGVEHFYGHAKVSVSIARGMFERFCMSKQFKKDVLLLIGQHSSEYHAETKCVRRLVARMGGRIDLARALFDLNRADMLAHAPEYRASVFEIDEMERILDILIKEQEAFSVRDLEISGDDILALGVEAGPFVGELLKAAFDAVVDERVFNEKGKLLDFIKEILKPDGEHAG